MPDKEWFFPDELDEDECHLPGVKNTEMGGFQWVIVEIEDVESDDGERSKPTIKPERL